MNCIHNNITQKLKCKIVKINYILKLVLNDYIIFLHHEKNQRFAIGITT